VARLVHDLEHELDLLWRERVFAAVLLDDLLLDRFLGVAKLDPHFDAILDRRWQASRAASLGWIHRCDEVALVVAAEPALEARHVQFALRERIEQAVQHVLVAAVELVGEKHAARECRHREWPGYERLERIAVLKDERWVEAADEIRRANEIGERY